MKARSAAGSVPGTVPMITLDACCARLILATAACAGSRVGVGVGDGVDAAVREADTSGDVVDGAQPTRAITASAAIAVPQADLRMRPRYAMTLTVSRAARLRCTPLAAVRPARFAPMVLAEGP
ncbi:hypothetical protein GCM10010454_02250 [Microbacterium arabinogalactanolyticum]